MQKFGLSEDKKQVFTFGCDESGIFRSLLLFGFVI